MINITSIYLTVVPGIMCLYFISQLSNISIKEDSGQFLVAKCALLLLPISFLNMIIINLINSSLSEDFDVWIEWNFTDFFVKMNNFKWSVIYLILSIFTSYLVAIVCIKFVLPKIDNFLNKKRSKEGIVPRDNGSPWDDMFDKDKIVLLEIYHISDVNNKLVGYVKNSSFSLDDKCVALEQDDTATEFVKTHNCEIETTFFDSSSGTIINKLAIEVDEDE